MIKKLTKIEDFKNKKILFSDEVLEALGEFDFENHKAMISFEKSRSVYYISTFKNSFKNEYFISLNIWWSSSEKSYKNDTYQEMFYSKEHGFYVEVEDEISNMMRDDYKIILEFEEEEYSEDKFNKLFSKNITRFMEHLKKHGDISSFQYA